VLCMTTPSVRKIVYVSTVALPKLVLLTTEIISLSLYKTRSCAWPPLERTVGCKPPSYKLNHLNRS